MKLPMAVILLVPTVLYACNVVDSGTNTSASSNVGTSSPASADNKHAEGNWQGTLTSDLSQATSTAIAFVNGWGEFRLVADGIQFVGWPHRTTTSIAGTVTGIRAAGSTWNDGTHSSSFELDGKISAGGFIEASYEGGGESGVFALGWSSDTESRIGSIVGTWVQYDDSKNIVASFQIDGLGTWRANIHGSHANGCTYVGETEAWTSRYSYDVGPFEVSGCTQVDGIDLNGVFSGTAALINRFDDEFEEPVLVIALSNDLQRQIALFLHRISG